MPIPHTAARWQSVLGFVPDAASMAKATEEKVAFLVFVRRANPQVTPSAMQRVLQGEISNLIHKLNRSIISWLAQELGDQFLTLCLKEVRESTATFAVFSLNQISEEVLSEISIKGKKKRYRDWREVVFTTVLETPKVEYATPSVALPKNYRLVTTNHELLLEADRFGNCSFMMSEKAEIVSGQEFIFIVPAEDNNEPVMVHCGSGLFFGGAFSQYNVIEARYPENKTCFQDFSKVLAEAQERYAIGQ